MYLQLEILVMRGTCLSTSVIVCFQQRVSEVWRTGDELRWFKVTKEVTPLGSGDSKKNENVRRGRGVRLTDISVNTEKW